MNISTYVLPRNFRPRLELNAERWRAWLRRNSLPILIDETSDAIIETRFLPIPEISDHCEPPMMLFFRTTVCGGPLHGDTYLYADYTTARAGHYLTLTHALRHHYPRTKRDAPLCRATPYF